MDLLNRLQSALRERYTVLRELGRGGMATVYLAEDLKHNRQVAIKVMDPEVASEVGSDRFLREISIAARLQHPNILSLYDSGGVGELLYYVMPCVKGESLRDRMDREGQLSVEVAIRIASAVAAGLQYAHEYGVVHRDVKPENVLLDGEHAVISDFGIAAALEEVGKERITRTGYAVGTPAYMSPEQAAGEANIDGRSDVYSLACVLYEMLAGEPPFTGHNVQAIIARQMLERPPSLKVLRPSVPPSLVKVLETALAKTRADRFPDASAFRCALESVATETERGSAWQRLRRGLDIRRPRYALAILVVLVSLLGLGAVALRDLIDGREPRGLDAPVGILVLPISTTGDDPATGSALRRRLSNAIEVLPGLRSIEVNTQLGSGDFQRRAEEAGAAYAVTGELIGSGDNRLLSLDLFTVQGVRRIHRGARALPVETAAEEVVDRLAFEVIRILSERERLSFGMDSDLVPADLSPTALMHVLQGQESFRTSDLEAAAAAFRQAIAVDSQFAVAYLRLSVVEAWRHDRKAALSAVEQGLAVVDGLTPLAEDLLRAQRHYVLSRGDSAITGYQSTVLDHPGNIDGWFGLSESILHLGGFYGRDLSDAASAFNRLVELDSSFAPIGYHVFDFAFYDGDEESARRALYHIAASDPIRPSREAAFALRFGDSAARDETFRSLAGADRYTISELFILFAHDRFDLVIADSIATFLLTPNRTLSDRIRGSQYRLTALGGLGDWARAQTVWDSIAGDEPFDRWLVHAYLSGAPVRDRAKPMISWAASLVEHGRIPNFSLSVSSMERQAFRALVLDATLNGDSTDVLALIAKIDEAEAAPAFDPMPAALRSSLLARLSLLAADTSSAIASLESSLSRVPDPSLIPFFPLLSMAPQRFLLAQLLLAEKSERDARRWLDSFSNTWKSAGDVVFAESARKLRRRVTVSDSLQTRQSP